MDKLLGAVTVIFAFLALIGQTEFNFATIMVGLLMGYCGARLFVRAK